MSSNTPMNWKTIEEMSVDTKKKWFLKQSDVARMLGRDQRQIAQFLAENNVPWYRVGKTKMYFLPEVMEAVNKRKWKEVTTSA